MTMAKSKCNAKLADELRALYRAYIESDEWARNLVLTTAIQQAIASRRAQKSGGAA